MNWNAESHNPQVHISNTLTERMFVKGPKKLFLKKMTHVIPGAMICYWRKTLPKAASKRIHIKLKECFVFKKNQVSPTPHPAPGCANFGRDFFRGSVFVTMTILRGTILAQVHHHFPNSH